MKKQQHIAIAVWFYSLLIRLYPRKHVHTFHAEMVQTFKDQYIDVYETEGKVGINFWIDFVSDDLQGIGREQILSVRNIPLFLLVVLCLLLCSAVITIRISPIFMIVMLVVMFSATLFFIKKLSYAPRKTTKPIKKVWVKHGVLYGLLLGLFIVPMNAVNMLTIQNVLSAQSVPLGLLFLAGMPLLIIMSGYTTGQASKEAKQGLFSGLLTAGIGAGVIVLSTVLLMFVFWKFASVHAPHVSTMIGDLQNSWEKTFAEFHWDINLGTNLVTTVVMMAFGAILGIVGGLIGKKSTHIQNKL